jgi:hypothetical protein
MLPCKEVSAIQQHFNYILPFPPALSQNTVAEQIMASQEERDRIMEEYMTQGQGDDDDDDDDDDEDEFDPDHEEESDGDEEFEAEEDDEDYVMMKGTLARHDGRLIYKGHILAEAFELKSMQHPLHWSIHHPTKTTAEETSPQRMRTIPMYGNIGKCSTKVDLVITRNETKGDSFKPVAGAKKSDSDDDDDDTILAKPAAKKSGDIDGDDAKMPSEPAAAQKSDIDDAKMSSKPSSRDEKLPATQNGVNASDGAVYSVFGKGTDASGAFEFFGNLNPSDAHHHSIPLLCQKRQVLKKSPAAAAAVAASNQDDDDDDADEEVDYDELIALHQDAGLSVADLRKRYHGGTPDEDQGGTKKPKIQEDESDDEYGF